MRNLSLLLSCGLILLATVMRAADPRDAFEPQVVKVLVLSFDPRLPNEGNRRLHEVGGWFDPHELARGYSDDVEEISHGHVRFEIVEWKEVEAFHVKVDGFMYTPESYLKCHRAGKGWHMPDTADYPQTFLDHGILPRVERGDIDEVWFFGGPYFGYNESAMAGPRSFYINGEVYDQVASQRPFAIMGFNYERGQAEMIHNLSHRTESTLARVYGGWMAEELTTPWAQFAANVQQSGQAGVGNCHYPPNGTSDYDYANPSQVDSTADDWLNYPRLTGRTQGVTCETWGGPDYQRNYLKWWFTRLPHAGGTTPDGRQADWWKYVFNYDLYDELGQLRPAPTDIQ